MSFTLREYQKECVNRVMEDLQKPYKTLGIIEPCGGGKTEQFIEITKRYLEQNPTKNVLILMNLSILTSQTFQRFQKRAPELSVGILQGSTRPFAVNRVVLATVHSAKERQKIVGWLYKRDKEVGLIIGDEIHNLIDTQMFIDAVSQHNAKVIGCTATPFRERKLITDLFDNISYTVSMQELIDQKRLVPLDLVQVKLQDPSPEGRIAQAVDIYRKFEMGKKSVVFFRTMEEAKLARNAFEMEGIKAHAILGDVKGHTRDELLRQFNNGNTDVLTTCNVLSAGFDSHKLESVIMPYGTKSPTLFMQRAGRGCRPEDGDSVKPEHAKQSCRVYMVGSVPDIERGVYQKIYKYVLNEGANEKVELDIFDEMELLDSLEEPRNSVKYKWTEQICEVAQRLKELNCMKLYDMIRKKKFPARYLKNPQMLLEGVVDGLVDSEKGMIDSIRSQKMKKDPWVMPSGKHVGKHVSELPWFYCKYVTEKLPNSLAAKIINKWWELKRNGG